MIRSRALFSIPLAAAALALAPSASAQQTPRDVPPSHDDWSDVGGQPGTHRTTTGTTTTDTTTTIPTTTATPTTQAAPVQTQPLPTQTTTSTTQTTEAEYIPNAGAEQERTIHPNRPMLTTGAILFGAPYVASVVVGAQSNLDTDHRLYIPVVGPWLDLAQRPCSFASGCTTSDQVGSAFLIASGAAQGAGIILALLSLAVPEKKTETVAKPEVHVLPISFAAGAGLGAVGTF